MKKRFTYIATALLCALLSVVMLTGAALPAAAESGEGGSPSGLPSLQYGIPERDDNHTLSASELYERVLGECPDADVVRYLEREGITMTYNSLVPDNRISTTYDSEGGVLTIEILPYTYVAQNGATVTWTPTRATVGDMTPALIEKDGVYTCRMEGLLYSEDFDMHVDYTWSVTIPTEIIEFMRNDAIRKGAEALAIRRAFEERLAAYEAQLAAHNEWVAYSDWLENVYGVWETELAAYNAAKEAYKNYCDACDRYVEESLLWEQWQDYFEYTDFVKNHLDDYNKYKVYESQMESVRYMMSLMESLFVSDSNGWQMYGSIMGGSVDLVLKNEDKLVASGNNPEDIRLAGDSTVALRKLLPKYEAIRSATYENEHDRTAAMFEYYKANYKALAKHFKNLYASLNGLFQNAVVKLYILENYPEKFDHYLQFVGQLYVVATCLDQSSERKPTWTIADKKLTQVVEAVHILPDGNWDPGTCTMPSEYVPPVEYVAPVDPPAKPQPTQKPVPPTPVVSDPGEAPAEPVNPFEGKIPSEVAHPGVCPEAPVFDELTAALLEKVEDGRLQLHSGEIKPVTLRFDTSISRLVSIRNMKTVSFYDLSGKFLHRVTVNYGDSVTYPVPQMEATAKYTFVPQGWVAVDGSVVDMTSITTDLSMIPSYTKNLRYYDVTWVLDGVSEVVSLPYGSTPKPPAKWTLSDHVQGHYSYHFSGWDTAPVTVTGDATYRGEMIKTLRNYTVTWILYGERVVVEEWPALSVPTYSGSTDRPSDAYVYSFKSWTGPVGAITGDVTYRAYYESTRLVTGGSNDAMDVLHGEDVLVVLATQESLNVQNAMALAAQTARGLRIEWESGFVLSFDAEAVADFLESDCQRIILEVLADGISTRYRLRFCDATWAPLADVGANVLVTLPDTNGKNAVFYLKTADATTRLEGESTMLTGSCELIEMPAFALSVTPNPLFDMSAFASHVAVGEVVSLKIRCLWGYEVVGATVTMADGTPVAVSDGLTFVMPEGEVSVTLEIAQIKYSVTFIVDGEIWHSAEYLLGEEIFLPDDPTLPAKDGYSFTFTGWGGDVPAIANGDERTLVFNASFVRAKQNADYSTGHNNNMLIEVYLPIFLAVVVLLTAGLITLRVVRKRRRKAAAAAHAEVADAVSEVTQTAEPCDGEADEPAEENIEE